MRLKSPLLLLLATQALLPIAAEAHERSARPAPPTGFADHGDRAVPALDLAAPLPEVAAAYVTTRTVQAAGHAHGHDHPPAGEMEWHFFREPDRIDIENVAARTGERWQRDGKVQFFFKVFHADRRSVEYRIDDLKLINATLSWEQHALLIDPQVLQGLELQDAGWQDGYPYRRYGGTANGERLDVTWRLDLNLPVVLERSRADYRERSVLKAVYPLASSPLARPDQSDYEVIDFADIGDRERDPFVLRVQAQLPGGDVHHH
ncbi:hypothetical protein [Thauera sinica]|uniref:Secreted protein n=1 Tax=Thauera sinica TaxID=2665146 RepID=A0ABW1AN52_9RHOO|nr:hypothetical protein [Thauera sp. K11]ATE60552.1 hypothetical protein CCZ27_11880 [Thauera sp. K11]